MGLDTSVKLKVTVPPLVDEQLRMLRLLEDLDRSMDETDCTLKEDCTAQVNIMAPPSIDEQLRRMGLETTSTGATNERATKRH